MIRKITKIILVLVCFILQGTLFKALSLGGVTPNLLLMITSFSGFVGGKKEGMFTGFFAGLFTDILYGNGIIGFYILLYVWTGYVNGMFNRLFYPEDVKLPLILTTVSNALNGFLTYVFLFLLRSRLDIGYYTLRVILPETVYTLIITIILFKPLLFIEEALQENTDRKGMNV